MGAKDLVAEVVTGKAQVSAEQVKAYFRAKLKSAHDEAMLKPQPQIADPQDWWNVFCIGPVQFVNPNAPTLANGVIKVGETAFIATVIVLNPQPILPPSPGISPASILQSLAPDYVVTYQTGNLTTWTLGPAALNVTVDDGPIDQNVPFDIDILQFTATTPGIYEMNVSCRLVPSNPNVPQNVSHFAAFAREVLDLDGEEYFGFGQDEPAGFLYPGPIRFQVYP